MRKRTDRRLAESKSQNRHMLCLFFIYVFVLLFSINFCFGSINKINSFRDSSKETSIAKDNDLTFLKENKQEILGQYVSLNSYNKVFQKDIEENIPIERIKGELYEYELIRKGDLSFLKKDEIPIKTTENEKILMEKITEEDIENKIKEISESLKENKGETEAISIILFIATLMSISIFIAITYLFFMFMNEV